MSVAKSLIKGAEEALAVTKGELEPGAMVVPNNSGRCRGPKQAKADLGGFLEILGAADWNTEKLGTEVASPEPSRNGFSCVD